MTRDQVSLSNKNDEKLEKNVKEIPKKTANSYWIFQIRKFPKIETKKLKLSENKCGLPFYGRAIHFISRGSLLFHVKPTIFGYSNL